MYQETIVVDRLIVVVSNSTKQGYCRQPFLAATRAAFSGQSGPYFAASF